VIDLLLTDVVAPKKHEKDLHSMVRDLCPNVKVLFMSGYAEDVLEQKGVDSNRHAFIQKPFAVHALAAKVREVLE